MYIKVTAGNGHGDVIFEASGPVQYDTISTHLGADATGEHVGDVNFEEAVGVMFTELHVLEINPFPLTRYEETKGMFAFRYAWWQDDRKGNVGVATTRNIFIVGDNGKTIDRA